MYGAAGELIAEVSGMPWGEFIRTRIFEPLGMDRTVPTLAEAMERRNVASPHEEVDAELQVIEHVPGLIRDEGLGVYVLGNRDHLELRHALMYRVFDLYDADPPRDWSAELRALYQGLAATADSARHAAEAERVEGTSPSLPLERYAGTYSDPLVGTVDVTRGPDGLRFRYGLREGTLEHWHYDTFRVRWDREWRRGMRVTFRLGPDGAVESLEVLGAELRRQE